MALYSAITIMVTSRVIDALAEGVDYAKVIYTITKNGSSVVGALTVLTDFEDHPAGRSESIHLCHRFHGGPWRRIQAG